MPVNIIKLLSEVNLLQVLQQLNNVKILCTIESVDLGTCVSCTYTIPCTVLYSLHCNVQWCSASCSVHRVRGAWCVKINVCGTVRVGNAILAALAGILM